MSHLSNTVRPATVQIEGYVGFCFFNCCFFCPSDWQLWQLLPQLLQFALIAIAFWDKKKATMMLTATAIIATAV